MEAERSVGREDLSGRGEQGIVLMVALLVMVFLSLLGATFLTLSLTESNISYNQVSSSKAFSLAEAGIELARKQMGSAPWPGAFSGLTLAGLTKEYSVQVNTADGSVTDWSTTAPTPITNARRIRWTGLTLGGGTYTVIGASVNESGSALPVGQVRALSTGHLPNSASPKAARTVEALLLEPDNFLKYGFSSTGRVFSDQITYASQPGGRNDSYNGGPGTFKPTLSTGFYSGGNVPTGGGWTSGTSSLATPLTFPTVDFAAYASSAVPVGGPCTGVPQIVNMNSLRDASGVVSISSGSICSNRIYYVDGSFSITSTGLNPTVSFIATHDIKNNATQGMTAVAGYPLFLTGGYIYMDTDNTDPLRGLIYSDGSHALAADRIYAINPLWVGHGTDLVYVESASQVIGAVAARIPSGSSLRLFGGGGSTVTYDMNLLNGLANLYVDNSAPGGKKYLSWREK